MNKALNLQHDLIIAYENYAQLHFTEGNYQQIIKDSEKILSITPDDSPALIFSAIAYIHLGDNNKAGEVLKNTFKQFQDMLQNLKININQQQNLLASMNPKK